MYDVNRVLSVAEAEVGYLEKANNKNLDGKTENAGDKNYTKYARDLDAIPGFYNGRKQGYAWCDVFVDWCFVTAYGRDAALKLLCQPLKSAGAGCRYSRSYYKAKGRLFSAPQPGDQIFFWPKNAIGGPAVQHTGLVYKVDGTYVYTIEGNTSGTSGVVANGGGVWRKKYRLDYNRIAGYGRPDYGSGDSASTDTPVTPAEPSTPDPTPAQTETPAVQKDAVTIVSSGGRVNVRVGNGTKYTRITAVKPGKTYPWVATAENGWHAIEIAGKVGWVSGEFSKKN